MRYSGRAATESSSDSSSSADSSPGRLCGLLMLRPAGVNQRAVVSFSAPPFAIGKRLCALPLPYDVVPTITARSWSWSAPAKISDALALPLSMSTTIGRSGQRCGARSV